MKNITTGQTITCQGQDVLLVVDHSADVTVSIKTTAGSFVPIKTLTEDGGLPLPGYAGTVYQITFGAGVVDVHGACVVQ